VLIAMSKVTLQKMTSSQLDMEPENLLPL